MIRKSVTITKRILLIIVIYMLLGINKLLIKVIPFKVIVSKLGSEMTEPNYGNDSKKKNRAIVVGQLIESVSKLTFWKSKCYEKALTAKELFNIFRIPSTVYFGIAKDEKTSELEAHAWVKHAQYIVTGEKERDRFKTIVFFGS